MFCTSIVPTINRPTLSRTVMSVLDQEFDRADHELIVVNDSGDALPWMEWQSDERVRVIDTNRHERSIARNTGAAIAKGKYLHFLDDDDVWFPGAMRSFWELDQAGGADWLFGGWQTVDNRGNIVDEFRPEWRGNMFAWLVAGESIPLQASLVRTESFFKTRTFDTLLVGSEDRDLERHLALIGEVTTTQDLVAQVRIGEAGSTTVWSRLAEYDRLGREKALSLDGAFQRVRASAVSPYWRGRVGRAYIASTVWNLKRMNIFIALSRLSCALRLTGFRFISPQYWKGIGTLNGRDRS